MNSYKTDPNHLEIKYYITDEDLWLEISRAFRNYRTNRNVIASSGLCYALERLFNYSSDDFCEKEALIKFWQQKYDKINVDWYINYTSEDKTLRADIAYTFSLYASGQKTKEQI